MSLAELSIWCSNRFARRDVNQNLEPRPFDLPWIVMDGALAQSRWGWQPVMRLEQILSEIADHAEQNPQWLQLCGVRRSL
jgi:CDP-paratose 2-epimerase